MGAAKNVSLYTLDLVTVGSSTTSEWSQELLTALNAKGGDRLFLVETPNGLLIKTTEPEHERRMAMARRNMDEDHELLQALADT